MQYSARLAIRDRSGGGGYKGYRGGCVIKREGGVEDGKEGATQGRLRFKKGEVEDVRGGFKQGRGGVPLKGRVRDGKGGFKRGGPFNKT